MGNAGVAEYLPLIPMPVPAAPVRTSRRARAPKLIRRARGVVGAVTDNPSPSSSMTLSSIAVPLVPALETLPRLEASAVKGEVWVGEVPDRPSVEMDTRRRLCTLAAAVAIGLGKAAVPAVALVGERLNRPVKVWPGVKEPRRF